METGLIDNETAISGNGNRRMSPKPHENLRADRPLRPSDADLRDLVENAPIGLHWVGPDGIILWANQTELDLVGYTQSEYLGHHIAEFHADQLVIQDMLLRLAAGETLHNYEARLLCKDRSIRYVLISSNALFADGKFIHTRCFTRDITLRKKAEQALATELAAARRLQEVSTQLIQQSDIQALYDKFLDAAAGIMRSDMASMQIVDESQDALRMLAFRGFEPSFGKVFELNRADTKTSCSVARRLRRRVVVPDVETCEFIVGTTALDDHRKTGIRAVQSTPLFSRSGMLIGMISTHWRNPHQPAEAELRMLDILARQAADLIERTQAEEAVRASEQRFRQMIDALPAAIYTTDAEGRLTYVNHAAADFFGRAPQLHSEQWCGGWKLFNADGSPLPHDECPMAIALKEGRPVWGAQAIVERPDGTRRWCEPYPTPLRDGDGRIISAINMVLDITERKRAEEALRHGEERYRSLVSLITDVPWVTDAEGAFTIPQLAWEAYTGQSWEEHRGVGWAQALHPEDRENVKELWQQACASRTPYQSQGRLWHAPSKQYRYFEARGMPLLHSDGTVREWVGACTDVDERKRAEEKLERTVAERTAALRAINEQLEAFVYTIAHDLRAPLRAMTAYSQLLVDDHGSGLDDTAQRMLKRIQASSEFMDKLLVDLLAYGRTARAELDLGPVAVQNAWEAAVFQTAPQIEQVQGQVETIGMLPRVRAHEVTLGQVLANLLSNSLKFVTQGAQPQVRFRAEDAGPCVRLWMEDNGIGIPVEYHERIFRVFERLHGSSYPGTGIGLSIVRKGVERMGGRIGLESQPGKGSRFWIELPKAD